MDVFFWQFLKNPPHYVSLDDVMTFLMILHSTCNGPFSWEINVIGLLLLDFRPRKNIHLLCDVPLVMRSRIHLNRYVGSSRSFYILSLRLDVNHCNSETVWFFSFFLFLDLSVLPPRNSVPLTFLGRWLQYYRNIPTIFWNYLWIFSTYVSAGFSRSSSRCFFS